MKLLCVAHLLWVNSCSKICSNFYIFNGCNHNFSAISKQHKCLLAINFSSNITVSHLLTGDGLCANNSECIRLGCCGCGRACLGQSVAGFSPGRHGFNPTSMYVIYGGQSGCGIGFSPVSIIPPMLHTHPFTYHQSCIMFLSQYFSFPLSVSFHQCSIPIHSPTTNAV
jgi:hypothetical protein